MEVACRNKAQELIYQPPSTIRVLMSLILSLNFYTDNPDGVGEKVIIFLFPNLYIYAQDTALDSNMLTTYVDMVYLLQIQKISPTEIWEAAVKMLDQWEVFLLIMMVPTNVNPSVYEINLLIDTV